MPKLPTKNETITTSSGHNSLAGRISDPGIQAQVRKCRSGDGRSDGLGSGTGGKQAGLPTDDDVSGNNEEGYAIRMSNWRNIRLGQRFNASPYHEESNSQVRILPQNPVATESRNGPWVVFADSRFFSILADQPTENDDDESDESTVISDQDATQGGESLGEGVNTLALGIGQITWSWKMIRAAWLPVIDVLFGVIISTTRDQERKRRVLDVKESPMDARGLGKDSGRCGKVIQFVYKASQTGKAPVPLSATLLAAVRCLGQAREAGGLIPPHPKAA
ncbi:hypothetical protein MKZ38_007465 [Zalerion maritima]|uniref:Uncharacterized protein n=1 Tax=Zalerion maritima TaxID=339359 RepID=A0AAD5WMX6_9PEZI|nr:hypothetical protein MKZ38_007465 [Zalerion maritima]